LYVLHCSAYCVWHRVLCGIVFCVPSCFVWHRVLCGIVFCVDLRKTAIISLYSIDWLVFITETECVYCAVRSTFYVLPHSVFMCFVWIWEQTAIISLYSIDRLVFITETECVYCAVRSTFYVLPSQCLLRGTDWPYKQFSCYFFLHKYSRVNTLPFQYLTYTERAFPANVQSASSNGWCHLVNVRNSLFLAPPHRTPHSRKSFIGTPMRARLEVVTSSLPILCHCLHSSNCSHQLCIAWLLSNNVNSDDWILVIWGSQSAGF
jgi:hypothetical protein